MAEGDQAAEAVDEDVVCPSKLRDLERRVRELERLLGKKTMEVEVLKEALGAARAHGCAPARRRDRENDRAVPPSRAPRAAGRHIDKSNSDLM